MTEQSFETLKVWHKSHQLMLDVHQKLIPLLPKEEKYGLLIRCDDHQKAWVQILQKAQAGFILWVMSGFVI